MKHYLIAILISIITITHASYQQEYCAPTFTISDSVLRLFLTHKEDAQNLITIITKKAIKDTDLKLLTRTVKQTITIHNLLIIDVTSKTLATPYVQEIFSNTIYDIEDKKKYISSAQYFILYKFISDTNNAQYIHRMAKKIYKKNQINEEKINTECITSTVETELILLDATIKKAIATFIKEKLNENVPQNPCPAVTTCLAISPGIGIITLHCFPPTVKNTNKSSGKASLSGGGKEKIDEK